MIAPRPQLFACLKVLYFAVLDARVLGWKGMQVPITAEESAQLADLMDAVHNLPGLLVSWEHCNEELLREMLADYDARHTGGLLATYCQAVAQNM